MKRSEMIIAMTEFWLGNRSSEDFASETEEFDSVSGKMASLLNVIENLGMKPPVLHVDPILYNVSHVWEREEDVKS